MTTAPIKLARTGLDEASYAWLATRAGVLSPMLPHKAARIAKGFRRYGGLGALPVLAAQKYGDRAAVIDELGTISYSELEDRVNAVANEWRKRGLAPGEGVAILARNHRLFLVAVFAAARCGARIVLLNTDFAGPQIREVAGREGTDLLVHDDEYAGLLEGVDPPRGRYRAWADTPGDDTLDALIAKGDTSAPPSAGVHPKIILLTSGTTGTPKGAPRPEPRSLAPLGALLSKVPIKAREITECPAPIFHTLGFAHTAMAVAFGSTLVLRRKFDPVAVLDSLEQNRASMLVVVPVMLQRMLDAPGGVDVARSFPHLRVIFVAGSQLGSELARRSLEAFGPVVYNMYGSTEVAYATVATPEDLAIEPGCVGSPVRGAIVKILDDNGKEVPAGTTGRIFVGNSAQFEGYTGGGGKEMIDGLMSSGDVGHIDQNGRLFIDGRDDDMIVSGGENVFPGEIEELLAAHPGVEEVSVIGVPDEKYGQRLAAFVVRRDGASLTEDEVRDHVKENLARYKTPREVHFLDQLPRNPTGKVLKRKLREIAEDASPTES